MEAEVKEPAKKENSIKPRHQSNLFLAGKFLKDYKEVLNHFSFEQQIEITEHLIGMIDLMEKNLNQPDEAHYKEYLNRETLLLKKYGKTLKPLIEKNFCHYFYYEFALVEKGIYTQQQYDNFLPEQKIISFDEESDYHQLCLAGLNHCRNKLYLQREPEGEFKQTPTVNYGIRWTPKRDNKNEFVQLIYALHQAGYINNGEGEIMKIVEAIAQALNLQLSSGWHSNHSNSIHRQNADYEPPVFKTIQESYAKYSNNLREEKKQRGK